MPTKITVQTGAAVILADTTDHSPAAANNLGTRTAQIDLTSLAASAYRQSAKFSLGTDRAGLWEVTAAIEWSTAPTAGGIIQAWVGLSHIATAGTGNPGNLSGSDAAYVGYGAAATDADECINQLDYIGSFPLSNDADVQIGHLGKFIASQPNGIIVLRNGSDQALIADAVEMSIRVAPVEDELQN